MTDTEATAGAPILEVQNVSKYFRSRRTPPVVALKDASITVRKGEFVSLLGPSGCGKTTVFNMIAGLIEPDEGRILIEGRDVTGKAGHVGYMLQKDLLLPWRTVLKNVTLGAQLQNRDLKQAESDARELLTRFGLAGFEDAWPSNLSGGMRQRAAVMRTLLSGRDILLLDEPFGALDAMTRSNMQEWLLDIWQEYERTVVFVTHDIDEAIFLSDRIVVMGSRPGSVRLEIDVDLPRPRILDDVASAAYRADLKHRIMSVIHGRSTSDAAPPAASLGERTNA
jgi:ABC-type nitrate/sulfonate/bicarbonate transport system ATPase subunit